MSTTSEPIHLNNHQRDTLAHILQHPAGHNIEWHDVLSLLEAVAKVEETHKGKYLITLGEETETIEVPKHKDIDTQMVVDLRRMLKNAGYGSEG
jgi:rubrerythrin